MSTQRNSMKVALAATLMGSLLLVACGGDDDNNSGVGVTATPTTAATATPTTVAATPTTVAATPTTVAATPTTVAATPTTVAATPTTVTTPTATSPFAASALDADGFYWFNATNDTLSLGYLVGEGDADASSNRSLDSAAAENSGEFISVYANALSTVSPVYNASLTPGNATVTSSKTGTITIPKASAALAVDGGYVVFKLPKVSAMHIFHFTTGTPYFSVETSADDGATWTTKLAMVKAQSKSGEYTADLSSYVTSTSKVWVRIRNGGTGGFNLQGVKIVY